jgi:hypothetical protein
MKTIKIIIPIYAFLIVFVQVPKLLADELNLQNTFSSNGWQKNPDAIIASSNGNLKSQSYSKEINGKLIYGIYVPDKSIVWFGKNNDNCVILNNKVMWIAWKQPTHLVFSDLSSNIKTTNDLLQSIRNAEDCLIKEPRDFTKIRQYKGAFGLTKSAENGTRDLSFGMQRVLKTFRFRKENLELTLSGSPTDIAIIEIAPNLDYVSSSVDGKKNDPSIVEVRQIRTENEYRRYINKKYSSDIFSFQTANAQSTTEKNTKAPPPDKKASAPTESLKANQARGIEAPQPSVSQDPMPNLLESSATPKDAVVEEHAVQYDLWMAIVVTAFVSTISYIFFKKKQRKS